MAEGTNESSNYFTLLNQINVSDKTEKKNGLTYLSWAWAWAELKKRHPDAQYAVYKDEHGWLYHTDGRTCWVETGVTVCGIEHIENLPVMDHRNQAIPADKVTSVEVNKAIQRSLTKAVARHGLGLYIYAGEDLPDGEEPPQLTCAECGGVIAPVKKRDGSVWTPADMAEYSSRRWGMALCRDCMKKAEARDRLAEAAAPPAGGASRTSDERQGRQRAGQPDGTPAPTAHE